MCRAAATRSYAVLEVSAKFGNRTESTADLAQGIVEDAQKMVRLEVELAKAEFKQLAIRNGIALGLLIGAGLLLMITILVAVPVLLVVALPWHWQVAVIWVVLYLLAGLVMGLIGRSNLKFGLPEKTLASIKETREWFSDLTRSRAS